MDWSAQIYHLGYQGQSDANKSLHVTTAPAIQAAARAHQGKRVAVPILPIDGHYIGMAGKNDTTGLLGANGGNQVGLLPIGTEYPARVNPLIVEKILNEID